MSATAAAEVLDQLRMLVEALWGRGDSTLHAAPTVAGPYAARALHEWNATAEAYDDQVTLHGLVERQATAHPQRLAVVADDGAWSYDELDRRANQVAHRLVALGVRPGDQVGLCAEKSAATVAGMLGVMKAGAAYVPIDPGYPASRISYMAGDAQLSALLTWGQGAVATAELKLPRIALDEWRTLAEYSVKPLSHNVPADAFAYAIYTSGSTGQPKCVLLNHRGRINNIEDYCRRLELGETDRVLCVSSLSFDISVCNIFCMFRSGGCVIFPSLDHLKDPDHWLDVMQERSVTFWHSAPALMDALLEAASERRYDRNSLRVALLGGDWVPLSQPNRARAAFPRMRFVTAGGATELSIDSTFYPVDEIDPAWRSIPYGRPLANQSALILDADMALLPPGVPGELHLGGAGMGAGYMNRPALTAEKFIPHPWPTIPGERLYRTGDLARYMPDGTIELLGRMDFQVKIRGMRIELGELESVLIEHSSVTACLASAPHDGAGDRRLVAYVVPVPGTDNRLHASLHEWLAARLPVHLVPEAFVTLERLPLTPNGKVDRRNLPAPDPDAYCAERAYEPPQGDTEQSLAALWQRLLGVSRVGRHDHFLDRGGHSLHLVRLLSRVRRTFGVELAQSALAGTQSLADMATLIAGADSASSETGLVPRRPGTPASPSFAQKRLWFITQMEDLGAAYHMPAAWVLHGALNETALRGALNGVLDRHEGLRSRFITVDGEPVLLIDPIGTPMPQSFHDLQGRSDAAQVLDLILANDIQAPFDLARDTLARASLIRMDAHEHVLLLVQHHIVSDGWSYAPLLRDIGELYDALVKDGTASLPPLPLQYADYAAWHGTWLAGERERVQSDYWRRALAGAPACIALPTDREPPAQQSPKGRGHPVHIDVELARRLRRVAQHHGTTLFAVVLAGWSVVLWRLSGQHDLVIGGVTANRGQVETESLIGFFVNALALRVDLSGDPSVTELLERVRHTVLGAQDHEDLPFERVVELSQVERLPGRTPLFQTMLAWQSHDEGSLRLADLATVPRPVAHETVRFEFELTLREQDEAIVGELNYTTALYDHATVARYRDYFVRVLVAMAADPAQAVGHIALMGDGERTQLFETFNDTVAQYPHDVGVHVLFEEQVGQRPDAVALVDGDASLTYTELNTRANRIAHRLIAIGAGSGDFVAVLLERSADLVIAQLAILKARAAYVPVDPQLPETRQAWLVKDAGARWVIAASAHAAPAIGAPVVGIDELLHGESRVDNPHREVDAGSVAYVMYTSGSTGLPKGVLVPHRAINRLVRNNGYAAFGPDSRVAFVSNPAFDAATMDVWGPLLNGGVAVVIDHATVLSVQAFVETLRRTAVDTIFLTIALFNQIADALTAVMPQLKTLITGGEAFDPTVIARVLKGPHPQRLLAAYGPTEATTFTTTYLIEGHARETKSIPIGRPISNARLYVLDAHRQPVPMGAVGELYIGGAGVALGYLNRPELTAERFLPDPFDARPDARMYRTGDLVRYLPDGNLVFMGRVDDQVKIRGYRIEPGEIEARLAEHPAVREVVVLVRQDPTGDKRLVAYVVVGADASGNLAAALRAHLAPRLPDYMIPAAYIGMAAFPLTPNGKLDRKALPVPDDEAFARLGYEAPHGEVETILAGIWQELLDIERVGRHDHFFELGGHSLLAVRLLSRIAQAFGVTLPLSALFRTPQIDRLALAIDVARTNNDTKVLPPIVPIPHEGALPLSFSQRRLWFLAQFERINPTYNIPLQFRLCGTLDVAALSRAFSLLFMRHASLRTVFSMRDGLPEAYLLTPDALPVLRAEDIRGDTSSLEAVLISEATAPFDLAASPLIRARTLRVAQDEYLLLLTLHHIVADEWSIGLLTQELGTLYRSCRDGVNDTLAPLDIQYPDFAAWQQRWLTAAALDHQATYWRERLTGAPPLLSLPLDHPRPPEQSYVGDVVLVTLDAALSEDIRQLGRAHGASPFMTVLAAWSVVLSRMSGQSEVVIGVPTANRSQHALEPLIGFFLNTIALRIDLSDEPDVAGLLSRVARTTLDAQANQDLQIEQVVEIINPPRRLDHAPLFQVILAWRTHAAQELSLVDLSVETLPLATHSVNFDLELSLGERDGAIVGGLAYATALFDRATIERYTGYLEATLRAMVADAGKPVSRIAILPQAERNLLRTRNDTYVQWPRELRIHGAFEQHAAHSPSTIAVVAGSESLTYAALNTQANCLAHHCIALGVRPNTHVALCVERGVVMVVAMLAIHKAGGAYVPLDASYPAARLRTVLDDADVVLVLADSAGHNAMGRELLATRTIVDLDHPHAWSTQPDSNPDLRTLGARESDAAYVIYTSGTTGIPKGVIVEHRQVLNFLNAMAHEPGLTAHDRLLAVTSISFDIAGLEIHLPLSRGARLVLAGRDDTADPARLRRLLHEQDITVMQATPAGWRALLDSTGEALPAGLRVLCGGEALSPALAVRLCERFDEVWNLYGPTETTIWSTIARVDMRAPQMAANLSIGRPIANTHIYLLDSHGEPVPLGAVGELYIGGDGVARGYHARPELNAAHFVPDPFSPFAAARMYRTGDQVRYLANGELEFLGRNDHQVKVRGYRIEPGDIEARLREHSAVRDAVVVARDHAGEQRLVAYVIPRDERVRDDLAVSLKLHLTHTLPAYMLPTAFVTLPAWPLTPNGKLDRAALPVPGDDAVSRQTYVAPQGETETMLAGLWCALLEVERVGRDDNFFDLGGHSLIAIRLISRIDAETGLRLEPSVLFRFPTLAELSRQVLLAQLAQEFDPDQLNQLALADENTP
ncbi:amino acid adenylation domain-containing protein [Rhodanobacter sp. AS-Z3]|uniref:non-ribosomal peptide synthetase n=1 Tax=Rhodanobacter sp. AS-Z3 TaxID=3031330 RepID=UPI00247AB2D4|nr:non-ribosomal peptide synthetase [Rhodanobacter sp. AS-Z3]WEN15094.1 amino acid adenylation domain-containing protein [Rhodanobacter sp. AS-Z3]